jgi:3',5'-cyclic AMP phosphodiesterase CpdA
MNRIVIAHLTDVHLGPIAGFSARYWNAKRALGSVNWWRSRRRVYRRDVLDRIVADLQAQAPNHIVVTGDLTNIGLPQEHVRALAWLKSLAGPERSTVIPGNHDIYSGIGADPGTRRWALYMTSDPVGSELLRAARVPPGARFPFVRIIGRVALIGLNSAVPTPPFVASGRLGSAQLDALAAVLAQAAAAGLVRLVLIHHPPLPGQASRLRGLEDAVQMQRVLNTQGAELVVHGHNHRNMLAWCTSPLGAVPIVGAPSASLAVRHGREDLARYNLYTITGPPWSVELVGRGLAVPEGRVQELERRPLGEPAAPHVQGA